jgi:hypothetical protein
MASHLKLLKSMNNFYSTSGEQPQKAPIQYKQIDCLLNPGTSTSWIDIVNKNPDLIRLFKALGPPPDANIINNKPNQLDPKEKILSTTPRLIPWSKLMPPFTEIENIYPEILNSFFYDCSYICPAIKNVYSRELSEQGWYRWVGPEPCLIVNLLINCKLTDHWIFSIAFHSFINDIDASNLSLTINGTNTKLDWLLGSSYQAIIPSNLFKVNENIDTCKVNICISTPQAYPSLNGDSRRLAFAIRTLSFQPLNLQ